MPNADVNRLGLRDGGSDNDELFLIKFTGEILSAFDTACKFKDKNYTRTITEGKSARFDALGGATARYRSVGENLAESGNHIPADEFTIALDGMLISHVLVDEYDEMRNHYEIRGRFARKLGESLAQRYDKNIAAMGLKAARSPARIPGGDGGTTITNALFATDTKALAEGFYAAAQVLDEKNVPEEGRWGFVRPGVYYRLAQNFELLNSLFGGTGSIREGDIMKIAGITLVKTNNLPNAVITDDLPKYNGDFSNTVALVMTDEAVGTVKRMELTATADWLPEYKSTLMTAQYLMGHDYLRPECAVELAIA